jgi:endonuclease/exonuclease/phosphatase family metal-dependent hydrolase
VLRLASFNVLHGRSLADGQVSTERLARACASLGADVLALQEIDRHQARSGGVDQTAAVAEAMGASHWRFEPALVGEPGATWRAATDGDHVAGTGARGADLAGQQPGGADRAGPPGYGVGLVSELPVRAWHVVRLRAAKVRAPVAVPGGRGRFILLPDEPRVVLAAEVETTAGVVVVATTHLSFVPGWNLAQLRRATRALAALGLPCVLLGDLNVPGSLPARFTGWRPLARCKTFPGASPSMQIDHALGHGLLPVVRATSARELPLSDHRALVVDFG